MATTPQQDSTTPKEPTPKSVEYKGFRARGHVRTITKDDWKRIGIENQGDISWDSDNHFSVNADKLTPEAIDFLQKESEFTVHRKV